jgi:hypothetical protein
MYRFYGQVVRFLAHGRFRRSDRFVLTTDKSTYVLGELVRVKAEVRDQKLEPETKEEQWVEVRDPEGNTQRVRLRLTETPGVYEGAPPFKPKRPGVYEVAASATTDLSADDLPTKTFKVEVPSIESAEPRMAADILRAIAQESRGTYRRLAEIGSLPDEIQPMRKPIRADATETKLWDRWELLLLFAALLAVEWIGRKVLRLL